MHRPLEDLYPQRLDLKMIRATAGRSLLWLQMCKSASPYRVNAECPFLRTISSSVFYTTFSSINMFMSSMLGAVSSGPEHHATSLLRTPFNGSACCMEITTVWIFLGSTDPSARYTYSIVTCV